MNSTNKSLMAGIGGALGALFLAMGAGAENYDSETVTTAPSSAQEMVVSYADLDLTHPDGRAVLEARIARAAEKVCGDDDYRRAGGLARAIRNGECQERAVNAALDRVPVPMVAVTD